MAVTWVGLDDLIRDLQNLPKELHDDAAVIVQQAAQGAHSEIVSKYQAHRHSGNLADHVKIEQVSAGQFGTRWRVRSTARHAWLFERGSQLRHTSMGWNRGTMPATPIFISSAMRHRRAMWQKLMTLVRSTGATVTGDI